MRRFAMAIALAGFTIPAWAQREAHHEGVEVVGTPGERFIEAVNKGDGKAAVALFTHDGFNMSVYGKNGGTKLEEEVQKVHEMGGTLTMKPDDIETLAGGRVVVVSGTWVMNYANNPTTKTAEGNFMRVLERGQNAMDWKIVAQTIMAGPTKNSMEK